MMSVRSNIRLYKFLGVVQVFLGFVFFAAVLWLIASIFRLVELIRDS